MAHLTWSLLFVSNTPLVWPTPCCQTQAPPCSHEHQKGTAPTCSEILNFKPDIATYFPRPPAPQKRPSGASTRAALGAGHASSKSASRALGASVGFAGARRFRGAGGVLARGLARDGAWARTRRAKSASCEARCFLGAKVSQAMVLECKSEDEENQLAIKATH